MKKQQKFRKEISILLSFFLVASTMYFLQSCAGVKTTAPTTAKTEMPAKNSVHTSGDKASMMKDMTVTKEQAEKNGCLSCHKGIASIREESSTMMAMIKGLAMQYNDPGGCVVCHGGKPNGTDYASAHAGIPANMKVGPKNYYPDPGSIWIAQNTCGQANGCHSDHVYNLERALMNTEAGKIQGNLHTWGVKEVQNHNVPWGNYAVKDPDGPIPVWGTATYKTYMAKMMKEHPKQFPNELAQIPLPSVEEIEANPHLAGFTYQRQQCQRCHTAVRGREKRGDYRGMGCSSCHIPYGNEGIYQGNDPTIDKKEKGHMMVHQIQATRKTTVHTENVDYSGIPVETCNSCHNRGKRIGVTYQGLMEFPYGTPFSKEGKLQPKLHTKKYLFISDDLHHQVNESYPGNPKGGLLCQDCHTSIDMHGDGNIFGTTLAQVEIECQDCHGTPDLYPWELPIGFSEEFEKNLPNTKRGLAQKASPQQQQFATMYDKKDGYILSTRGNPLGNVVKDGDKVVLHSATGTDFMVPVLKTIKKNKAWRSADAEVAMDKVKKHNEELECYTCHASWVPQCYGCHVKVDYSAKDGKPRMDVDWITSGSQRDEHGQTAESRLGTPGIKGPGKVKEGRSYLRWEDPVLGINGEGRVTPLMPGCQIVYTVIDRNGNTIAKDVIARSYDEGEELGYAREDAPLAIDMAPVQPHSAQRKARTCESCHNNPKTAGLGIGGGVFQLGYPKPIVEDLIDQRTGKVIPSTYKIQIPAIPSLVNDWSAAVDRKTGKQVQTVGTHWELSRALNTEERDKMLRTGLCMGCHQNMSDKALWDKVSTPGSLGKQQHIDKMHDILMNYKKK